MSDNETLWLVVVLSYLIKSINVVYNDTWITNVATSIIPTHKKLNTYKHAHKHNTSIIMVNAAIIVGKGPLEETSTGTIHLLPNLFIVWRHLLSCTQKQFLSVLRLSGNLAATWHKMFTGEGAILTSKHYSCYKHLLAIELAHPHKVKLNNTLSV